MERKWLCELCKRGEYCFQIAGVKIRCEECGGYTGLVKRYEVSSDARGSSESDETPLPGMMYHL